MTKHSGSNLNHNLGFLLRLGSGWGYDGKCEWFATWAPATNRDHVLQLIFQEDNHTAVKFFIQRDLPDDVRAELTQTILELGGRVEEKVPRQGYVLISPGTAEGQRLRECWALPDRPHRFFVPYTFVEACKVAGTHLRQIFVENGAPIPIHIHSSIANVNARSTLSSRIMVSATGLS